MWIADNQWLSESRSWFAVLYRIIPAAPPCRTLYPLSTRPLVPRRQMTTFPVYVPAGAGLRQSLLGSVAVAFARTTSVGVRVPAVTVTPGTSSVGPFVEVRCSVEKKCLFDVEAPTVFVQGPACSDVPEPGPLLPADALTRVPAAYASKKAPSTGSV